MKKKKKKREIGDRILEAGILGSLADEYMAIADCTKALECFEDALAIFDTQSHRQGRANTMLNLAEGIYDSCLSLHSPLACLYFPLSLSNFFYAFILYF
jgi:hypothetical protein